MSKHIIKTLADLYDYFGSAPDFDSLNRRAYKNTSCGASVSLYGTLKGKLFAVHNGQTAPKGFIATGFTVQTIAEGSDAEVNSDLFTFGKATDTDLDDWIEYMEAEASDLWAEANEDV